MARGVSKDAAVCVIRRVGACPGLVPGPVFKIGGAGVKTGAAGSIPVHSRFRRTGGVQKRGFCGGLLGLPGTMSRMTSSRASAVSQRAPFHIMWTGRISETTPPIENSMPISSFRYFPDHTEGRCCRTSLVSPRPMVIGRIAITASQGVPPRPVPASVCPFLPVTPGGIPPVPRENRGSRRKNQSVSPDIR